MSQYERYFVSYRYTDFTGCEHIPIGIYSGTQLAELYRDSAHTGNGDYEILYVYRVEKCGSLQPVHICRNWEPPYNWLIVCNEYGEEIMRHEWKEESTDRKQETD